MSYTQSFLPLRTQDGRILGMLPITTTAFTGNETSKEVTGGGVYPVSLVTPTRVSHNLSPNNLPVSYMAITVTPTQERTMYQSFDFMASFIPMSKWAMQPGFSFKTNTSNALLSMISGKSVSAIVVPSPATVTASNGSVGINWSAAMSSAGLASFVDVNWVSLLNVQTGNTNAASINPGAIDTGLGDPSNGKVALYVVSSNPEIVNQSVLMSTLRFVKLVPGGIPVGAYKWSNAVVTNTDGSTATVCVTLNVT